MKKLILLFFLSMHFYSNAQNFTIDNNGVLNPARDTSKIFNTIKVSIDKSFDGAAIEIYSVDGRTPLSLQNARLGDAIQKNGETDLFELTFNNNLTIKECSGVQTCFNVSRNFKIKLKDTFYGPFHLSEPANVVVTPPEFVMNRTYTPGNLISDAFFIYENFPTGSRTGEIKYVLEFYGIKDAAGLAKNKFLDSVLKNIYSKAQVQGGGISLASFASSIGGLDVTKIADGFARFVVERTKQELSITFFNNFKEELNKYPDLKTLFPTTVSLLEAIDKDIYNYSNYLNSLREAFRMDILVLDENLPGIIDNHKNFFYTPENYKYAVALKSGCYISTSVRAEMHPGDILENYPIEFLKKYDGTEYTNFKAAIQSLQLLSFSLKDTSKDQYWVPIEKIRQVVSNKTLLKLYLGLVYQSAINNYDSIRFSNNKTFIEYLDMLDIDKSYNDYTAIKQYVLTFGSKVNELNRMIVDYEKTTDDSLKVEQYARYFSSTVEFLEYCTKVGELPYINQTVLGGLHDSLKIYFDVAYQTIGLATSINRKNYTAAITEAVAIYNTIVNRPALQTIKPIDTKWWESKKDTTSDTTSETYQKLMRFGAFMASVVEAKNSDEVAKAIEAAAMPAGSARVKRESRFNVSLNAYTGVFAGYEHIRGVDNSGTKNLNFNFSKWNSFGVSAPIGIGINWGHSVLGPIIRTGKYAWSSSLFLSVVDLGAIAAFRFTNDSTEEIPTVQLQDIFSPGIFYSLGIPNSPISFNIGYQMGPLLRRVTVQSNDYGQSYSRFSIGLCVDIPLLNFYTRSR